MSPLSLYGRRGWTWPTYGMSGDLRNRMIERFHDRKMAAERYSVEHRICTCVVLALVYGASARTIHRQSKLIRRAWSRCENSQD